MKWAIVAASCALFVVASLTGFSQDQTGRPTFRAAIGLVQLDVSVVDVKHHPIRGLQASDFTVLEDGKSRPIRAFESVDLPAPAHVDAQPTEDASSRVVTNQAGNQDGRLVFILMDRTIPVGQPVVAARKVAAAAINALGPSDLAAVITTGGNVPQTLTTDRARLLHALDQNDWSTGLTAEQLEIIRKVDLNPDVDGRCMCGLCVLETVTRIAEAAREAPRRRKLLLFIGSSIIVQAGPRDASADIGCGNRVRDAREKMVDALALSHLTVDSIDPTGLTSSMYQGSGNGKQGQDGPIVRRQKLLDDTIQRLQDQGNLEVLPSLTGGRSFTNTNAPEQAVKEIFQESSSYYVLAYEPAAPGSDSRRRAIDIKVARPGARVATVRAAVPEHASNRTASARGGSVSRSPLDLALSGLMPEARVPLEMSIAPFAAGEGSKAYVNVSLNAEALAGGQERPVDVAVVVLDQRGRHVASIHDGGLVVRPPANLQTHFVLPPGDFELRAAVQTRDTGVAASVFSQVTIPAFADAPLSMSGLVIGTEPNLSPPADEAAPDLPILASTDRTFRRGQAAWLFAHVYEGTGKSDPLQPIDIRTIVMNTSGRIVRNETATMGTDAFIGRHVGIRVRIPVASLPPGKYVLSVEAARGTRTVSRSVAYEIQ